MNDLDKFKAELENDIKVLDEILLSYELEKREIEKLESQVRAAMLNPEGSLKEL